MYYDPYNTNSQKQGYQTGPLYSTLNQQSAGDEGGGGGNIDWSDFASGSSSESHSQSWSGQPEWMSNWAKGWWDDYINSMSDDWRRWEGSAQNYDKTNQMNQYQKDQFGGNLNTMRGEFNENTGGLTNYIEQSRQLRPEQFRNQMDLYTERSLQPVLNKMSSRGILNSSVTGGALSDVLRDQQAKYLDEVTQANVWAADKGYDTGKYRADTLLGIDKYGADKYSDIAKDYSDKTFSQKQAMDENYFKQLGITEQMIPSIMNALRESRSESSGMGSSYGGLMELLMAGFGGGGE